MKYSKYLYILTLILICNNIKCQTPITVEKDYGITLNYIPGEYTFELIHNEFNCTVDTSIIKYGEFHDGYLHRCRVFSKVQPSPESYVLTIENNKYKSGYFRCGNGIYVVPDSIDNILVLKIFNPVFFQDLNSAEGISYSESIDERAKKLGIEYKLYNNFIMGDYWDPNHHNLFTKYGRLFSDYFLGFNHVGTIKIKDDKIIEYTLIQIEDNNIKYNINRSNIEPENVIRFSEKDNIVSYAKYKIVNDEQKIYNDSIYVDYNNPNNIKYFSLRTSDTNHLFDIKFNYREFEEGMSIYYGSIDSHRSSIKLFETPNTVMLNLGGYQKVVSKSGFSLFPDLGIKDLKRDYFQIDSPGRKRITEDYMHALAKYMVFGSLNRHEGSYYWVSQGGGSTLQQEVDLLVDKVWANMRIKSIKEKTSRLTDITSDKEFEFLLLNSGWNKEFNHYDEDASNYIAEIVLGTQWEMDNIREVPNLPDRPEVNLLSTAQNMTNTSEITNIKRIVDPGLRNEAEKAFKRYEYAFNKYTNYIFSYEDKGLRTALFFKRESELFYHDWLNIYLHEIRHFFDVDKLVYNNIYLENVLFELNTIYNPTKKNQAISIGTWEPHFKKYYRYDFHCDIIAEDGYKGELTYKSTQDGTATIELKLKNIEGQLKSKSFSPDEFVRILSKRKVQIANTNLIVPSQDDFTEIWDPKNFLFQEISYYPYREYKSYEIQERYYRDLLEFLDCIDYSVLYKKI